MIATESLIELRIGINWQVLVPANDTSGVKIAVQGKQKSHGYQ